MVRWTIKEDGYYDLLSFEPYTYRFIQVIVMNADAAVRSVSQFRETYPDGRLIHSPIRIPKEAIRHLDLVVGCVIKKFGNPARIK